MKYNKMLVELSQKNRLDSFIDMMSDGDLFFEPNGNEMVLNCSKTTCDRCQLKIKEHCVISASVAPTLQETEYFLRNF